MPTWRLHKSASLCVATISHDPPAGILEDVQAFVASSVTSCSTMSLLIQTMVSPLLTYSTSGTNFICDISTTCFFGTFPESSEEAAAGSPCDPPQPVANAAISSELQNSTRITYLRDF